MIDAVVIAKIFATYMGVWALGYGVGKAVAWVRALGSVA